MAANTALSLPIDRYSIEEAAESLGCRPAQVFRMAGSGELPLYIHMKPHTSCHIDSIAMSEGLTIPIDKVMQTLAKGDHVVIHGLEHNAHLRLLESDSVYYAQWQNAKVMIGGFWRVSSVPFECLDLYGADSLNCAILTAWHKDEARGCVIIRGAHLPAINDARLWVMPEDLRRLCSAPEVLPAHQEPIDPDREMVEWSRAEHWAPGKKPGTAAIRADEIKAEFNITKQHAEIVEKKACPPEEMAKRLKRSPRKK